jgi:phosphatidylglycerophosphatase C
MTVAPDVNQKTNKTPAKKQLVLFDFDGTITTKDTLAEFMIFSHGKVRYMLGLALLSPVLASYVLKLMPNWKSKQYFLTWFLGNKDVSAFEEQCRDFSKNHLHTLIRPRALEAIRQYKKSGATVAVVSASAENWVKPWCDQHGLRCVATRLETKNHKLTGKILGKNCHGQEKVMRIREEFRLEDYDEIIAYGDTSGDREMLALAHQGYYRVF